MFDFNAIEQAVAAFGLGVLVMLLVELGKRVGLVKDGTAGRWATGINVVLFAALALVDVFGVDLEGELPQAILGFLAVASQLALAILGAPVSHQVMRKAQVFKER